MMCSRWVPIKNNDWYWIRHHIKVGMHVIVEITVSVSITSWEIPILVVTQYSPNITFVYYFGHLNCHRDEAFSLYWHSLDSVICIDALLGSFWDVVVHLCYWSCFLCIHISIFFLLLFIGNVIRIHKAIWLIWYAMLPDQIWKM